MNTPLRHLAPLLSSALLTVAALLPVQARSLCAGPAQPESRATAFDADRLFLRDAADLSPTGQLLLQVYADALDAADVELIVIKLPVPAGATSAAQAKSVARQRAEAVRRLLVRHGVSPGRIYTAQHPEPLPADLAPVAAPLVIETVAGWRADLRTVTCIAGQRPGTAPAALPGWASGV